MSSPYRWAILALTLATQTGAGMAFQTMSALSPIIIADLELTRGGMGLLFSFVQIGMVVGMFVSGLVVDRFGERFVLVAGPLIVCLAMASLLGYSLYWLPLALFLIGFGASGAATAGTKGVLLWFPPQDRGLALGIRQMGIPAGGALAAALLPYAALQYGWSVAASMVGGLSLLLALLLFFLYRNGPRTFVKGSQGLLKAALNHYRGRALGLTTFWAFTLVMGQFIIATYLVLFFHTEVGLPLVAAIPLLVLAQIAGAIARLVLGWTSDRIWLGRRQMGLVITATTGIAIALSFSLLPDYLLMRGAPLFAIVAGFALIGWNGLAMTLVMELVPPREAGSSAGVFLSVTQFGAAVGPASFGFLADSFGSYRPAWFFLAVILAVGLAIGMRAQSGTKAVTVS